MVIQILTPNSLSHVLQFSSDFFKVFLGFAVIDFLGFTPSTVAAAAAISAAGKSYDTIPWEAGDGQFFHERVNRVNIYNLWGVIDNFCCQ